MLSAHALATADGPGTPPPDPPFSARVPNEGLSRQPLKAGRFVARADQRLGHLGDMSSKMEYKNIIKSISYKILEERIRFISTDYVSLDSIIRARIIGRRSHLTVV